MWQSFRNIKFNN